MLRTTFLAPDGEREELLDAPVDGGAAPFVAKTEIRPHA